MADYSPYRAPEVVPKKTTERVLVNWKFERWMDSDETVSSVSGITVSPGGAGALTFGSPGSSGQAVSALSGATGTAGQEYVCTCSIVSSKGQELDLESVVKVS